MVGLKGMQWVFTSYDMFRIECDFMLLFYFSFTLLNNTGLVRNM